MPAIDRIGLGAQMRKHVTFAADGVNDAAVFNVEPVNAAESTPGKGKLVGANLRICLTQDRISVEFRESKAGHGEGRELVLGQCGRHQDASFRSNKAKI